jgi:hypothetical protein
MSEYQYYEFLAIDRPLTDEQMAELRSISSRAEITPTHFSNEYNYGDLKADPHTLLKRYFDAHVYVANWGTHQLSLRLPAELVEVDDLKRYCVSEQTSVEKTRDIVLLDIYSETEDYEGWVEGAGWMASLAPVREEILRGDLRGLYLAWLLALQNEELDPDDTEPNVPPGLGKLSAPLQSLSQFLRLDEHLMTAAAEGSAAGLTEPSGLQEWIAALPSGQKDALLLDIAQGRSLHVGMKLLRGFRSETGDGEDVHAGRTVGALLERSEVLRDAHAAEQTRRAERDRRQRDKAAAVARAKRLDDLAKRQAAAWKDVEKLVSSKKPKAYDEAVSLLKDLHDLGDRDNETEAFASRLTSLRDRHTRKPSFIARLERARLQPVGA